VVWTSLPSVGGPFVPPELLSELHAPDPKRLTSRHTTR
jgi:hypothetical protein